jgi:hypothetical protein
LVKVNDSNLILSTNNPVLDYSFSTDSLPMDHAAAMLFNANPPPVLNETLPHSRKSFIPPKVGDTRDFVVETFYNSGSWISRQATLRACGKHGNVWVMNENYTTVPFFKPNNKINSTQAKNLANKFDLIYPAATFLLGYEYGGGPAGDGGKDGDPKIQILVLDIVNEEGVAQAGGFFWSQDYYR